MESPNIKSLYFFAQCRKCGYTWVTKSTLEKPTCPNKIWVGYGSSLTAQKCASHDTIKKPFH